MKKYYIYILLLITLCVKAEEQENCNTLLKIFTNEPSSVIFINDSLVGFGNAEIQLERGGYFIKARKSLTGWGSRIFSDSIDIDDCDQTMELTFNFDSRIYLETDPQDVYIYNNDSLIGHTPQFISNDLVSLQLWKPEYIKRKIELDKSKQLSPIKMDFSGNLEDESFIKSDWFKILFVTAAVLGTTAAYFKLKADNKYDEYLETRNKNLLDKTEDYDLYSGIAFGMLQLNFGAIMYFFISDNDN